MEQRLPSPVVRPCLIASAEAAASHKSAGKYCLFIDFFLIFGACAICARGLEPDTTRPDRAAAAACAHVTSARTPQSIDDEEEKKTPAHTKHPLICQANIYRKSADGIEAWNTQTHTHISLIAR